jgi:hypothetical protein
MTGRRNFIAAGSFFFTLTARLMLGEVMGFATLYPSYELALYRFAPC